jgi:hypothetical protein
VSRSMATNMGRAARRSSRRPCGPRCGYCRTQPQAPRSASSWGLLRVLWMGNYTFKPSLFAKIGDWVFCTVSLVTVGFLCWYYLFISPPQ